MSQGLKQYTLDEVSKHNKEDDLWVVIDSYVYDLSDFIDAHPGGEAVLLSDDVAGQDVTETFFGLHPIEVLTRPQHKDMIIGRVQGQDSEIKYPTPGMLSKVPYAEPDHLVDPFKSPYYKESHRRLQKEVRKLVDEFIRPEMKLREADNKPPSKELFQKLGEPGIELQAMRLGPGPHLKGRKLLAGVKPEEFDYFHELVINQEISRVPYRGAMTGLGAGMVIGLPPVLNFGSDELKEMVVDPVFRGDKYIALAITEAFAGSDVMGLKTYAKISEDGSHYIVNGTKKWITNGNFADYFSTAVRTDDGFAMLLIPRSLGVKTRIIKTSYSSAAGTAFVMFNNIKVPSKYIIGQDGMGIPIVLSNFNHERWVMCCSAARSSRGICEVLMMWIHQRKVFGKPLTSQAVVRQKLAYLLAQVQAAQAYLEHITYQMCNMTYKEQSKHLAGQIALLKAWITRVEHEVADDSVQIMGGRGLTASGLGQSIEAFNRTYKFDAVLGGTEEVMADLGIRQAFRFMPKDQRI